MKGDYIRTYTMDAQTILNGCNFVDLDKDDDSLVSLQDFVDDVDSGCITDYDGWGELVLDGNLVSNSSIMCSWRSILLRDVGIISFVTLTEIFGDRVEIMWYNK